MKRAAAVFAPSVDVPKSVEGRVRYVVAQVLRMPLDDVRSDSRLAADLGCDGLDMVEIQMALEEHFEICRIPDKELDRCVDLSALTTLVSSHAQMPMRVES